MDSIQPNKTKSAWAVAALSLATLVPAGAQLAGQLGVLDLAANGGINPATAAAWQAGDTYRLVFVTSATTNATSADIATYNAFVQGVANASTNPKLGNSLWKIVGSTATVDARDNTGTNPGSGTGVAVFLMNGATAIATSNADLWDGIAAPVNLDENGSVLVEDRAFTGTLFNGTRVTGTGDQPLGSFGAGLGNIRTGRSDTLSWMTDFSHAHTNLNSVFAMSDPLTIVDLSDTTAPTLVSITDDKPGGTVDVPESVLYTVTFSEPMSAGTVNVADFENDPSLTTAVTIDSVVPTANPAVYQISVTTTEAGSLRLQIKAGATLADLPGNAMNTASALPDDSTLTINQDLVPPTLVSITDNVSGGPITATKISTPTYTVTFDEPIDPLSVGIDDFGNDPTLASPAPLVVNSATATGNPAVFLVAVTTSGTGDLRLQINQGASIKDASGNDLDTSSALTDDTTITVTPPPALAGELGVLDVVNANGGINPATGLAWAVGDSYRLMFLTSQTTDATSTDIATYNTFVQGVAAASTTYPDLGNGTWKIVGSTETVAARDNTGTNPGSGTGVAIFLTDGHTKIADNNADLWDGSIDNTVSLDENASPLVEDRVFTGSYFNGTSVSVSDPDKPLGVLDGSGVQTGQSDNATFWIRQWKDTATNFNSVYAMSDPLTVQSTGGNDFATWISNPAFGIAPGNRGFDTDADGDGLANGVEAWFGTNPGTSNAGLVSTGKSGSVFSFQHPEADPPLSDVNGSYEWSIDLSTWNAPGTVGDTTVAITATPLAGITTVEADTAGSTVPPVKLFVRGVATQN